jgi:hypothetical protein
MKSLVNLINLEKFYFNIIYNRLINERLNLFLLASDYITKKQFKQLKFYAQKDARRIAKNYLFGFKPKMNMKEFRRLNNG